MVATYRETIKLDITCSGSYDDGGDDEIGEVYDQEFGRYEDRDAHFSSTLPLIVLESEPLLEDVTTCSSSEGDLSSTFPSQLTGEICSSCDDHIHFTTPDDKGAALPVNIDVRQLLTLI